MRSFMTIALQALLLAMCGSWARANDVNTGVTPPGQPPSIEEFLAESALSDVAISPSGNTLANLIKQDDAHFVTMTDTETLSVTNQIPLPEDLRPLWITWANEDRLLLAFIVGELRATSNRIQLPSARIIAMNRNGSDAVALFDNQRTVARRTWNLSRVTDILPHDPNHVLMPGVRVGDLDLWKVNVNNGEAERIAFGKPQTYAWRTDITGAPAFRFDRNSRGTVVRIFAPDAEGRWHKVATVREDDLPAFRPVAAGPSSGISYEITRPEGVDRAGVYLYDATNNRFTEEIASHPRVDVDGVYINSRTREYLGYFVFDDIFEVYFKDEKLQAHIDGLRDFFGDSTSFFIRGMSEDSQVWIIEASAPDNPGWLYLYDRERTHLEAIAPIHPSLTPNRLGRAEVIRYSARDGEEITGYLTWPTSDTPGPHPLILMPHGGPEARDTFNYTPDAQFLATRGYAVFQPNFRGSSGYGRAFAEAGYGEWGGKMQDDLTDAVGHLVSAGVADPNRVCIMGASYGGYAALAGAAFTPTLYQCAISIAGVSDLIDQLRFDIREGDEEEDEYVRKSIGHPREGRDKLKARSPADHAERIQIPVLLVHGDRDRVVPPNNQRS